MNVLANHGYINRDGKAISVEAMVSAFSQVFNFAPEQVNKSFQANLQFARERSKELLSLDDLKQHFPNSPEHDGSISRPDQATSMHDWWSFDESIFRSFITGCGNPDIYNLDNVANGLVSRFEKARLTNGNFTLTSGQRAGSYLQQVLWLQAMGQGSTLADMSSPRDVFQEIFRTERIPAKWIPNSHRTSQALINAGIKALDSLVTEKEAKSSQDRH